MNRKRGNSQDDDKLEGRYANCFKVGYNAFEFVIDFGQCYNEEDDGGQLHTRIVTNPFYAKTLLEMLRESVEQYEQYHGTINENDENTSDELTDNDG
jgi:hypothetical protein